MHFHHCQLPCSKGLLPTSAATHSTASLRQSAPSCTGPVCLRFLRQTCCQGALHRQRCCCCQSGQRRLSALAAGPGAEGREPAVQGASLAPGGAWEADPQGSQRTAAASPHGPAAGPAWARPVCPAQGTVGHAAGWASGAVCSAQRCRACTAWQAAQAEAIGLRKIACTGAFPNVCCPIVTRPTLTLDVSTFVVQVFLPATPRLSAARSSYDQPAGCRSRQPSSHTMGTTWTNLCPSAQQPTLSSMVSFLLDWHSAAYLHIGGSSPG